MPAPNAAALGKYGDYPVNSNKGVPSIGIPIYQAQEGPLSLPITLNYHAGGVKLGEMASWVGLGWSLSAGGMITRTVQGLPDDKLGGYYYTSADPIRLDDKNTINAIADNSLDSEPDLFAISLNGYTGKFYIDHNQEVQLVPHQDIRITVTPGSNGFNTFVLTGTDGTRYIFGKDPTGRQPAAIESTIPTGEVSGYRSSWYLLRMESQDRHHEITFDYATDGYGYRTPASCKFIGGNNGDDGGVQCPNGSDDGTHYYTRTSIDGFRLAAVNTTRARIEFSAVTDRLDLDGSRAGATDKKRLDAIKVNAGEFCKTFAFDYDYFVDSEHPQVADGKRLRLTSLQERGCNSPEAIPPYTFSYYGTTDLPYRLSKQTDHWGYYNGATGNDNLQVAVPPTDYVIAVNGNGIKDTYGEANKVSNSSFMRRGTLRSIAYPTGGYTEYTLEANKVDGYRNKMESKVDEVVEGCLSGSSSPADPVEVVVTFDEIDLAHPDEVIAKFNVLSLSCSSGQTGTVKALEDGDIVGFQQRLDPPPYGTASDSKSLNEFFGHTFESGVEYTFIITATNARAEFDIKVPVKVPALVDVGGLRVAKIASYTGGQSVVKEYDYTVDGLGKQQSTKLFNQPSYGGNIRGRRLTYSGNDPFATAVVEGSYTVFFEQSIVPLSSFQGSHLGYSHIRETIADGDTNAGWTQREYFVGSVNRNNNWYPSTPYEIDLFDGKLKASSVHNQQADVVAARTVDPGSSNNTFYLNGGRILFKFSPLAGSFFVEDYQIRSGAYLVTSEVNMRDGVTTTTTYTHNNDPAAMHLLPTAVETTHSDGRKTRTDYTYSVDPEYRGVEAYDVMTDRNILVPITTSVYTEGQKIDGTQTDYQLFGSHPYPGAYHRYEVTWDANGTLVSNPPEPVVTIDRYTHGYPATIQKRGWKPDILTWTADGLLQERIYEDFTWTYKYINGTNLLERVTDVDDQFIDYSYDALMRLQTVTPTGSGGQVEQRTTYSYVYQGQDPERPGNYVKTRTVYTPQPEAAPYSGLADLESYRYFDGLGRPLQTVLADRSAVEKTTGGGYQDQIVEAIEYDPVGRPYKRFAPFLGASGTGQYVDPTDVTFSLTEYYADPLGRVRAVTPPAWEATVTEYSNNESSITHPGTGRAYVPGSLFKTTTTDPEGLAIATFTDSWGRDLLTRKYGRTGALLTSTFTEYDAKNRITKVYPPGAGPDTPDLMYKYTYDGRDNVTGKKLPDRSWEHYHYDERNLPTFTSMSSLPTESKWLVTVHDAYGRPTHSGFGTTKPDDNVARPEHITADRLLTQITFGTEGYLIDKPVEERVWVMEGQLPTGRVLTNSPGYDAFGRVNRTSTNSLLSDRADGEVNELVFDPLGRAVYTHHTVQSPSGRVETFTNSYTDHAGRAVQEAHKLMRDGEPSDYTTVARYGYTAKGEIAWEKLGGTESQPLQTMDFTYLENGWLDRINDPANLGGDLFALQLDYDVNRTGVTNHTSQKNGNISAARIATASGVDHRFAYTYDELNQLTTAGFEDAANSGNHGRYSSTYAYDARGNLESLTRQGGYGAAQTPGFGAIDDLSYTYADNSNQLLRITDATGGAGAVAGYHAKLNQDYTYDDRGNTTLDAGNGTHIDYNHLDLPYRFRRDDGSGTDIIYTVAGQKVARIEVDATEQPTQRTDYVGAVEYRDGQLAFVSHAAGRVIPQDFVAYPATLTLSTDHTTDETFLAGAITSTAGVRAGTSVEYFAAENIELLPGFEVAVGAEFLAEVRPGITDVHRYEYFLRDHLGSNRILFADMDGDGKVKVDEVLQENHSYAFGLEMEGAWQKTITADDPNRYRYNGKELNPDLGLYDYGLRNYDPSIGRWLQIDPKAEKYTGHSGYNYVLNNPIGNTDPNGDTVRVYTETINSTYHQGRHTYIRVTTEDRDVIVEVYGPDPEQAARGTAVPQVNEVTDESAQIFGRANVEEHAVERPEGVPEGDNSFEDQIIAMGNFFKEHTTTTNEDGDEVNDYVHMPTYGAFGPNSNGYANAIIELAGGKADLPIRAVAQGDMSVYKNKVNLKQILKPFKKR